MIPVVRGIVQGIVSGIGGGFGSSLVFHALDDIAGSFVNDVIIGVGVETEGNTSTRFYPDDTASPIWQSFATGVQGMVYAGARWWQIGQKASTNSQIRSFDLTNVEWTATTMTVTKDQTGMRNDANGACKLVATAGNATVIANAITDASDDQLTRWFIKRVTGTGVVEITVDGGSTWEDVTTEVDSTAGFNECLEDQAALTNPQIGIRLVTSADAVDVGNAEAHLGDLKEAVRISSPIFTAASSVTINANDTSFDDANHDDTQGLWFCEFRNAGLNGINTGGLIGVGGSGRFLYTNPITGIATNDGIAATQAVALSADDTEYKLGLAYGSALRRTNIDGVFGTEVSYDGEYNNNQSKIRVLCQNNMLGNALEGTMLIRNIRRYNLPYAQAQAKIEELMA